MTYYDSPSLEDEMPSEMLALDREVMHDEAAAHGFERPWDALGSCGCRDYHYADCPTRSLSGESEIGFDEPSDEEPSAEDDDDTARCPVCADPIDYCQGHGEIGDPAGFARLAAHDDGDHTRCHPDGCPSVGYVI